MKLSRSGIFLLLLISPDASHTTTLSFTRFLAGPADFTFCYPNSKFDFSKNLKASKGQAGELVG